MNHSKRGRLRLKGVSRVSSSSIVEYFARIVSYCRTSRKKSQIMAEMNLNDIEAEAFTAILIRQRLLDQNFDRYQTTERGHSYLDTRNRLEVALRERF